MGKYDYKHNYSDSYLQIWIQKRVLLNQESNKKYTGLYIWFDLLFFFKQIHIKIYSGWQKRANTNTNKFGLNKKDKYKYKDIWVDKTWRIQIQIRIFTLIFTNTNMNMNICHTLASFISMALVFMHYYYHFQIDKTLGRRGNGCSVLLDKPCIRQFSLFKWHILGFNEIIWGPWNVISFKICWYPCNTPSHFMKMLRDFLCFW